MTRKRGYCFKCSKRTSHLDSTGRWFCTTCEEIPDDKLTIRQKNILELLNESSLTDLEIKQILKSQRPTPSYKSIKIPKKKIIFGIISDSHIGHECYDSQLMDKASKTFNERNVDFVIHAGDICEGHYESKRQGSIFELDAIGADAQVKKAVAELSKIKGPIYAVVGNHEHNTFGKMAGFNIGDAIHEKLPRFKNIGIQQGYISLPFGKIIGVLHPNSGSSYAISYRSQKIVESIEGGKKPEVLILGNFHKAEYLFYRNVHVLQAACLQNQTPFMRNLHISAHKGYWVVSMDVTPKGIKRFIPEFYPAYD